MCNAFTSTMKKAGFRANGIWDPLNIADPLNITPSSWMGGNKPFTYDRNYGGALAKWYRDSTRPPSSSAKYEYVAPAKTQQSLYSYDAGANYQPVQQAAYQPPEENDTVKVISEDSDRTKIS